MNFKTGPRFVYRISRFSKNEIEEKISTHTLEQLLDVPEIGEMLSLSTPDFWRQVAEARNNGKLTPGLRYAVERYLMRSGTRSTPFGLFAGCGVGKVSPSAPPLVNPRNNLRAEVVKLWLHGMDGASIDLSDHQRILTLNPAMQLRSSGAHLYRSRLEEGKLTSRIDQVGLPEELIEVLEDIPSQFEVDEIIKVFSDRLGISLEEAKDGVKILIDHEVILGAKSLAEYSSSVEENCLQRSQKAAAAKQPYYVLSWKSRTRERPLILDSQTADKLLSVAEQMAKIWGPVNRKRRSSKYIAALLGYIRSHHDHGPIPLLSISPQLIGPWLREGRNPDFAKFNAYLGRKIIELAKTGGRVWKLSAQDCDALARLTGAHVHNVSPAAMTVLAQYHPGEMLVYEYMVTNSASRLAGRFGLMDEELQSWINEIQSFEKKFNAPHLTSDINYRCQSEKQSFIGSRISSFDAYIDLVGQIENGARRIPLSEVGIAFEKDLELFLVSLKTGERIIPQVTNMLGFNWGNNFALKMLRLLAELSNDDYSMWSWDDDALPFDHFPRVVLKGVVVAREFWVIKLGQFNEHTAKDLGFPASVRLVENDMKMVLKTGSEQYFYEINRKLVKEKKVIIEEDLTDDDTFEICVTGFNTKSPMVPKPFLAPALKNRCDFYFKVFIHPADHGHVMAKLSSIIGEELRLQHKFLFLYYEQGGCHLRTRFFNLTDVERERVQTQFLDRLSEMQAQSAILKFASSLYEPEINRWQGEEGLHLYEEVSISDSAQALEAWSDNPSYGSEHELIAHIHSWTKSVAGGDWIHLLRAFLMKVDAIPAYAGPDPKLKIFLDTLPRHVQLAWLRDILHLSLNRRMGQTKMKEKILLRKAYEAAIKS